jgi:hypothetical protein
MLHMSCQMQEMHKGNYTYATKELPHKTHKPPAPRGEAKRARHHWQKSKEHKTHKLPLNSCIKAKEHTKLTLHTWDRAKSLKNQVTWPRPNTWRSQIHLPLSFLQKPLILVHHPRKWCTSMSPTGYEAEEPPPISTKCSLGLPPATQNQERERANDSTLGLVPKVWNQCRAISSKVGLATFILSNLSNLEPPWENHSRLTGGVRVPRKRKHGP